MQSNFGGELVIDGVPIGKLLRARTPSDQTDGSIMVIIATDAPLSSRQIYRLAKCGTLGLARCGSNGGHGSGDYFIAFSTTYRQSITKGSTAGIALFVKNESRINGLFCAAADAVEEAILNSIFKAETMTGKDARTVPALPIDQVVQILNAVWENRRCVVR